MKKLLLFFLIVSCFAYSANAQPPRVVKIGVSSALSGEAATYGMDLKDSLLFAGELLKNDEVSYQFVFEDDKCSGKDAVSVAHKLIHVDKVDFAMGFACSGAALAALPLYQKAKIPTVVTCASSHQVADAGDYVFRTIPSDFLAAKVLQQHIAKKHRRIAVLSEETDYAQNLHDAFSIVNHTQVELITESYLPNTTDFKTVLLKLRTANPEGLFINSQSERTFGIIFKQLRDMKWDIQLYGAYWPGSPSLLSSAGKNLEGVEFVDMQRLNELLNDSGQRVYADFQKRGHRIRSLEILFLSNIEGLRMIDSAIRSGDDVRKHWREQEFNGLAGRYRFDERGEIIGLRHVIRRIENAQPVLINPKRPS